MVFGVLCTHIYVSVKRQLIQFNPPNTPKKGTINAPPLIRSSASGRTSAEMARGILFAAAPPPPCPDAPPSPPLPPPAAVAVLADDAPAPISEWLRLSPLPPPPPPAGRAARLPSLRALLLGVLRTYVGEFAWWVLCVFL